MSNQVIRTLSSTSLDTLTSTVNEAFSTYAVPATLTRRQLETKNRARSVDLSRSYGAFEGDRLIGFILNGFRVSEGATMKDAKIAYNSGMGVVPSHQGQGVGRRLLEHTFERLGDCARYVLEVITSNERAHRLYERTGFEQSRVFRCFDASAEELRTSADAVEQVTCDAGFLARVGHLHAFSPSWQNADASALALGEACTGLVVCGATGEPAAFGVVEREAGNLMQFGFESDEAARLIVERAASLSGSGKLRCVNVDERAGHLIEVLEAAGLRPTVDQFEMIKVLGSAT